MNKATNVLFCGTGGQGVLKASEILALAAMHQGFHVKKSEVHGMAQRGGSVESHVRFGDVVHSPLIAKGEADYLVSFHAEETKRWAPFLAKDGKDLTSYLEEGKKHTTHAHFLNTFLLGVLSKQLPSIKEENWVKAIEEALVGKSIAENLKIFTQGRTAA